MSNLEDRLKAISKVNISEAAFNNAKEQILAKANKKRFELAPIIVTGFMFALMCLLIFMPSFKTTDRASSLFTEDIKEIQFLENKRPNINHNVNSFNYIIAKKILDEPQQLEDFQAVLKAAKYNTQPWTENLDDDTIYDFAVVMKNGEIYQLKYKDYDATEDAVIIYDVKNKVKYVAKHNEGTMAFNMHLFDGKSALEMSGWVVLTWYFGILVIYLILSHFYNRKYSILDERGKPKTLKGWAHYVPYILFIIPIFFMWFLFGTYHIGVCLILLFLYALTTSQLQLKLGVMRPNNIHFKFLLPFYTLCVIIALLLILVV